MKWFQKNFKTLIYVSFLVPILTVAIVSISHVTKWYGISNPISWAVYLSIGVEIAALSALAAISAKMGRKVYFPFIIVTIIQFIGNIFFAYQYIDINNPSFKDWVDMVDPVVSYLGVESGNILGHKRFLALFAGGMLPLISLSFLHMLVKFEEEDKNKSYIVEPIINLDELSIDAGKKEALVEKENKESITINQKKIEEIEKILNNLQKEKFGNNQVIMENIPQKTDDSGKNSPKTEENPIIVENFPQEQEDVELIINNENNSTIIDEVDKSNQKVEDKIYSDDESKIKRLIYMRRNG